MRKIKIQRVIVIAVAVLLVGLAAVIIPTSISKANNEVREKQEQLRLAEIQKQKELYAEEMQKRAEDKIESLLQKSTDTVVKQVVEMAQTVEEQKAQAEAEAEAQAQAEAEAWAQAQAEAEAWNQTEEVYYEEPYYEPSYSCSPSELRVMGVIYSGGWRYTWYSENVLPGGGLNIPGRWSDGDFVRDGDGYLCVASSDLAWGTVIDTPWGAAKVYDSGCDSGTIDMYVSW